MYVHTCMYLYLTALRVMFLCASTTIHLVLIGSFSSGVVLCFVEKPSTQVQQQRGEGHGMAGVQPLQVPRHLVSVTLTLTMFVLHLIL